MSRKLSQASFLGAGLPALALAQPVLPQDADIDRSLATETTSMAPEPRSLAEPSTTALDFQLFSRSYRLLIGSQQASPSLGSKYQFSADSPVASTFEMSELSMSLGLWSVQGSNPLNLDLTSSYWQRNLSVITTGIAGRSEVESGAGMGLGVTVRPVDALALALSGHNLMGDLPDTHWSNEVTQEWHWRGRRYWQFSGELKPFNGWSVSLGYRQDTVNKEEQFLLGTGFELNNRVALDFTSSMTREQALEAIFRTSVSF